MLRRSFILAATALLLSVAIAIGATTWRRATVGSTPTEVIRDLVAAEHLRACPGKPLSHDSQLIWIARWKAMDMGLHGVMSHSDEDGHRVWDFYDRAGVPHAGGSGENIGWNTYPDAESPHRMFEGWMASSGHRALIRSCTYTRFGVGAFKTKAGSDCRSSDGAFCKHWYVVEFTKP